MGNRPICQCKENKLLIRENGIIIVYAMTINWLSIVYATKFGHGEKKKKKTIPVNVPVILLLIFYSLLYRLRFLLNYPGKKPFFLGLLRSLIIRVNVAYTVPKPRSLILFSYFTPSSVYVWWRGGRLPMRNKKKHWHVCIQYKNNLTKQKNAENGLSNQDVCWQAYSGDASSCLLCCFWLKTLAQTLLHKRDCNFT